MDNNKENSQVIMAVQKATLLMDPFFKITAVGTAMLITYFMRLHKEKLLNKRDFKDITEFMKATDGKAFLVNVPVQDWIGQNGFDKELERLREMGVRYKLMPDLNRGDGYEQIMVYEGDRELFNNWYEAYLSERMQGGKHEIRDLKNLTDGKTTIISIPFEGDIQKVYEDFEKLGINYALLPDLNVGDGEIQMLIANRDMPQVQEWYELYASDMQKKGIEVPDMKNMQMNEYTKTGEMTEEQYINTADEEHKRANEKYEGAEPGEIEKTVMEKERAARNQNDAAYEAYHTNPDYIEISVDKKTLVEDSHFEVKKAALENGMFYSRVPGTWHGRRAPELTLLLPLEQVFEVNDGETYLCFIAKNQTADVRLLDGNPASLKMSGEQLYKSYYDPVERKYKKKEQMKKNQKKKDMNNFEHRKYDFDELEREFLKHDSASAAGSRVKNTSEKTHGNPIK